jgi:hypothetical protein
MQAACTPVQAVGFKANWNHKTLKVAIVKLMFLFLILF